MAETTIRLRAGTVIELVDGDEEICLKVFSFGARGVTTYLAPDEIHQLVVALSGDDYATNQQPSSRDEEVREGVRELDEIAMAAWRARTALHLNLAELCRDLDSTTGKNLIDLVNDLNEHMPLGEDGHTWRQRPAIRDLLADTSGGER